MKLKLLMAAVALILISACSPSRPMGFRNNNANTIAIITVECRNEHQVHQTVVQTLKMARVSDWRNDQTTAFETIEARYEELSEYTAAQIEQLLKQMPGVTDVTIKWETGILQNAPQRAPLPYTPRI